MSEWVWEGLDTEPGLKEFNLWGHKFPLGVPVTVTDARLEAKLVAIGCFVRVAAPVVDLVKEEPKRKPGRPRKNGG
jgi:hypothetical protein